MSLVSSTSQLLNCRRSILVLLLVIAAVTSNAFPAFAQSPTVPGAPTIDSVCPGNGTLTVSWAAPTENGGAAITSYDVQYKLDTDSTWTNVTRTDAAATTQVITGLTNGSLHDVQVRAVNSVGSGAWAEDSGTPAISVPCAPNFTLVNDIRMYGGEVFVRWEAPPDGGSPITGYRVEIKPSAQALWEGGGFQYGDSAASRKQKTFINLVNGTQYDLRVRALNSVGNGAWAEITVIPRTRPAKPIITEYGPVGEGDFSLSWNPPEDDGGSPITGYEIAWKRSEEDAINYDRQGNSVNVGKNARQHTIEGVFDHRIDYDIQVRTVTEVGPSFKRAVISNAYVYGKPDPPAIGDVVPGDGKLTINWSGPFHFGGTPITAYKIRYRLASLSGDWGSSGEPDEITKLATDRSHEITGLTNDTPYRFVVRAVNMIGDGLWGEGTGTPVAPMIPSIPDRDTPLKPTINDLHAHHDRIRVRWTAPEDDGGSNITGYKVQWRMDGSEFSETQRIRRVTSRTKHTITGLTVTTRYDVRVIAYNTNGDGEPSDVMSVQTRRHTPSAPVITELSKSSDVMALLSWDPPEDDGGWRITGYQVRYKPEDASGTPNLLPIDNNNYFAQQVAEISPLTLGTRYTFRVRAEISGGGFGDYLDQSFLFGDTPDAPSNLLVTPGDGKLTLTWDTPSELGHGTLTSYDVEYKTGSTWIDVPREDDDVTTTQVITSLTNDIKHDVRVRAVSTLGDGSWAFDSASPSSSESPQVTVPDAPTINSVTSGNEMLTVSWTAPTNTGGTAITSYDVQYKLDTDSTWTDVTRTDTDVTTTQMITSLTNDSPHDVQVRAVNSEGAGAWAADSGTPTTTVPGAPTINSVKEGNGTLTVSWTAPDDGGETITSYDVQYKQNTSSTWNNVTRTDDDATTQVITSLMNDSPYDVQVRAVNSVGAGAWAVSSGTPAITVPGAPTINSVTPGNGTLTVSWTAPDDGGETITSYVVQYKLNTDSAWTNVTRTDTDDSTTQVITSLMNDSPYDVQVRAVNTEGAGAWAADSGTPTDQATVPGAPKITRVDDIRNREVFVTWDAPADGGSPITGYRVEIKPSAQTLWEGGGFQFGDPAASLRQKTFTNLENGTLYDVRVRAVNSVGSGEWAEDTARPRTVPRRPTIDPRQSGAGNGTFTIVWTHVPLGGGTPETGFEVWWRLADCATCEFQVVKLDADRRSYIVTALDNMLRYDFRLYARNAQGLSDWAFKSNMLAAGTPRTPTIGDIVPGNGTLTINWTPPSDNGGRTITGYKIRYRLESRTGEWGSTGEPAEITKAASDRSHEITGLTNGTLYEFAVRAVSEIGDGLWAESTGTPVGSVPAAPTITSVASGNRTLTVSWTAPDDGGETITSYDVQYKLNTDSAWTNVTRENDDVSTTQLITSLTNDSLHDVQVRAVNSKGEGAWAAASGTPAITVPGAPTIDDDVTSGNEMLTVSWSAPTETGGAAITAYEVQYKRTTDSESDWDNVTRMGLNPSQEITGLTNGQEYDVRVRAINSVGGSDWAASSGTPSATVPGAPVITSVTGGSGTLTVSWTAPTKIGGATITAYEVQYKLITDSESDWDDVTRTGLNPSQEITSLTNGQTYDVRVRAVNSVGGGDWAASSGSPNPSAVTSVQVTDTSAANGPERGNATARVFLRNIAATTTVHLRFGSRSADRWVSSSKSAAAGADYVDFGMVDLVPSLQSGFDFDIETSLDSAFPSASTVSTMFTSTSAITTVPGAPSLTEINSSNGGLTVTWTAPTNSGGATITAYEVQYQLATALASDWSSVARGAADISTGEDITGLTNGAPYNVRVRAVNPRGGGAWAEGSGTPAAAPTPPGTPTDVLMKSAIGELTVTWSAPVSNGGATITSYDVRYKEEKVEIWTDVSRTDIDTSTMQQITGLMNGVPYDVEVRAVNSAGAGEWTSESGTPTSAVPGKPTITDVTPGNGMLTVSWTVPESDGGSAITSYDVRYKEDTATGWTDVKREDDDASTMEVIENLKSGKTYDLEVRAVNSAGGGEWADDSGTIPTTVPGAPRIGSVTSGNGILTVSWTAPKETGGVDITSYDVQYKMNTDSAWIDVTRTDAAATTQVITSLTNDSLHDVQVRAVNSVGSGAWAESSGTPSAKRITSVQVTDKSSANATARVFLSNIESSTIVYLRFGKRATNSWNDTSRSVAANTTYVDFNMTSLVPFLEAGRELDVEASLSDTFPSAATATTVFNSSSTVSTVPDAPTIDDVTPGEGKLTLSWTAPVNTGGATITAYEVQYRLSPSGTWNAVTRGGADSTTSQEITGLTDGETYDVQVRAVNPRGAGAWVTRSGTQAGLGSPPGPPTINSVESGDATLTVNWSAPAESGGADISGYRVEWQLTGGDWTNAQGADLAESRTSYPITSLTNGTEYDVRVRASNSAGDGDWAVTVEVQPGTPPGAPTINNVAAGNGTLIVTWTAPAATGGVQISGYRVEWKETTASLWTGHDSPADATSYSIPNLTNSRPYDIQVAAVNAIGRGAWATDGGTPGTVPGVPEIGNVEPGDGTLTVPWTAPGDPGSSAITSYETQYKDSDDEKWTDAGRTASDQPLSQVISGLTNGDEYDVRVRAVNSTGSGGWAVSEGTPGVTPDAPTITDVKPADSSLVVMWTAPTNPGSSEVTGYRLEWKESSDSDWTGQDFAATSESHEISGLINGTSYDIQLRAANTAGAGAWATDSGTPATVPGAPTVTDATPDDSEIALTWTAPTAIVGSALTGYKIQWKSETQEYNDTDRLAEVAADATSHTITPLDNGARYTVRVIAVNGIGDSEPAERSVILIGVPNPPTNVRMTRGAGELVVEWNASESDELRPVTSYVVRWKSGTEDYDPDDPDDPNDSARELVVASTDHEGTIPGLENGIEYTARVLARNGRGESQDSSEERETPGKVPDAPAVTVAPGDSQLKVDWSEPSDTGGFAITEYRVQWKSGVDEYNDTDRQAVVTSGETYTILTLTNGTSYTVRVMAVNEVGPGAASDEWTGEAGLDTSISGVSVSGTPTQTEADVTVTIVNQDSREETVHIRYREATTAPDGDWSATQMETTTTEESVDFTLTPLTANTGYEVEVSFNADFPADAISTTTVLTASTVPSAPTEITLTPSHRQIQVSWVAPDDGGSDITGYRVEWSAEEFNTPDEATVGAGTLTHTFSTISNGVLYEVVVTAINANGDGSSSEPVPMASSTLPEEPASIAVDRGASGELVVRWAPPTYDGDSEITGYVVQWKEAAETFEDDASEIVLEATERNYRITALTDGELYDVRVLSINANGRSEPSESVRVAPGVVAGAPTNVTAIHGNGQLTISWQPPQGGIAPDKYTVEWKQTVVQSWSSTEDAESPHSITALTNGVLYDVRVLSVTGELPGVPSGVVNNTPSTLPGAPTGVALSPGSTEIAVAWAAPGDTGGAPISGYVVQWKPNANPWSAALSATDFVSPYTITGLANDTVYDVRVIALNLNGQSGPSITASATPVGLTLPGISAVTADEQSIETDEATVTVTVANQNEEPESVYVRFRPVAPGDIPWSAIRSVSTTTETIVTFTLSGLDAHTEYQVQASLVITFPADSSPSTTFTTLNTVPGAPTSVVVTPGDEELTVSWSSPGDDGGSEISAFVVQWSEMEEGFTQTNTTRVDAPATTAVISGLANGTGYRVRVFALNEIGTSEPSEIHTGTPAETVVTAVSGISASDITQFEAKVVVRLANQSDAPETVYMRYRPSVPADSEWSATEGIDTVSETTVEFMLSGLEESTGYEVQVSMDDSFNVDSSLTITFETLDSPTQEEIAISAIQAFRDSPTDATITVEIGGLADGATATVYLRYRPVPPDSAEWAIMRRTDVTTVVVQFALSGLQETVEYEVEASLDESFLSDATLSAVLGVESVRTPQITEVLAGDGQLTVVWTASDIPDVSIYDLRYGVTEGDWTVLSDILDGAVESPIPEPPPVDQCVMDLGILSEDVTESGEWIQDCASENRSGSYARYFSFTLEESAELRIDLTSEVNTYLFLLDGEGRSGDIQEENDDVDLDAGNNDSRIESEFEAGTYTLEATTYAAGATGHFTITIDVPEPDECVVDLGILNEDVTESGEWIQDCASENRSGSYARYFSFILEESAELKIVLMSEVDPYLFLLDGGGRSGAIQEENDDIDRAASNYNSRIESELEAGTYTLEATTYAAGATGHFTITIDVPEPDVAPATATAGSARTYEHVQSHQDELRYTLTDLPNGVTHHIQVRAVTAAGAGEWSSSAAGTPIEASVVEPEPEPADICVQLVETDGSIESGWDDTCLSEKDAPGGSGDRYVRFYTFTLTETTDVVITLNSEEDTYLYLMDGHGKDGDTLHSNDDIASGGVNLNSRLSVTLQPGDYTIEATTYHAEREGDFTLIINGLGEAEEPTPAPPPDPEPEADTCVESISADGTIEGTWDGSCLSDRAALRGTGDRYSRFYTFRLDEAGDVTITLTSTKDTYLYLLERHGRSGTVIHEEDDIDYPSNTNSRISENLQSGDYTIEATTYYAEANGGFTLTVEGVNSR